MKKLLLGLMFLAGPALAGDITASWVNPTTYTDGSVLPATDIQQVKVEYGTCVGAAFGTKLGEKVLATTGATTVLTGLAPGTYCLQVRVMAKNVLSAPSNVATKVIIQPAPNPPTNLTVVDSLVYERHFDWQDRQWELGRRVGKIKLGTMCRDEPRIGKSYFPVPRRYVKFDRRASSGLLYAKCA